MPFVTFSYYSEALKHRTKLEVVLPQSEGEVFSLAKGRRARLYPVLYLFHGYPNDSDEYTRYSTYARYIENYPLVVIIPNLHINTFLDIGKTHGNWTYITDELPALAQAYFPISHQRKDTFVAGLSMGGYGAFKLGLSFPERYAAAGSLSGVLDFAQQSKEPWWQDDLPYNYRDLPSLEGGPHDLFYLARQMAASNGPKTRLYAIAGTDDFIYKSNLAFKQHAESLGLEYTFEEAPGNHDWEYFDPMIPKLLAGLGLHPIQKKT